MKIAFRFGAAVPALFVLLSSAVAQNVVQVGAESTAMDASALRHFGDALDLSGDSIVVGGEGAYVFRDQAGSFVEEVQLFASFTTTSFGNSVAIDGDRVIVGEKGDSELSTTARAFVYLRTGSMWSLEAVLPPFGIAPFFDYGCAVDISPTLAAVGSPRDGALEATGVIYIYLRTGTSWALEEQLTASDGAESDRFGTALALDGNTCVGGAPRDQDAGPDTGAAYVFLRTGTTWAEQAKIAAFDQAGGDLFGSAVAISGDTLAVGSPGDSDAGISSGAVYVYTRSGSLWSFQQKLVASDAAASDSFGSDVSLDGDRLVVGAGQENGASLDAGAAYYFERDGNVWSEQGKFVASDANSGDRFGDAVAVEGENVVFGAPLDDEAALNGGSVYAFVPLRCARPDDAFEPNDVCAAPTALGGGTTVDLLVFDDDADYYSLSVPSNNTLDLSANFVHALGDIDLRLYDAGCGAVIDSSLSATDGESVSVANTSPASIDVVLEVVVAVDCNAYSLDASLSFNGGPGGCAADDAQEPNDSCAAAVGAPGSPVTGLLVSSVSAEDWYTITVPTGMNLDVDVLFLDSLGDIDARLEGPCGVFQDSSTSASDNEQLSAANNTGLTVDYKVRVSLFSPQPGDCNGYSLSYQLSPGFVCGPPDGLEDNDTCPTATMLSTGTFPGLNVEMQSADSDWYSVLVPDGATLTIDVLFLDAIADLDVQLFDACGGSLLDAGTSTSNDEQVTAENLSGTAQTWFFEVFVWSGSTGVCNDYDLVVDLLGGMTNFVPYCFGDGSGTPCPCGNNSTAGHPGGCAHSFGDGAILSGSGSPSVSADTMNFDLSSAPSSTFALLVSANNQLPGMGACIGCGIPAFDGLRCAGGGFLRHGTRSTNINGEVGNGWGPPGGPPGGLIAASGFSAGQTRNFFAFVRADQMATCFTGQNSSNGVSVSFLP